MLNIDPSTSLLPSQRRLDNLETASPLSQPILWVVISILAIFLTIDCRDYYPKAKAKQVKKLRGVLLVIQKVFSN